MDQFTLTGVVLGVLFLLLGIDVLTRYRVRRIPRRPAPSAALRGA